MRTRLMLLVIALLGVSGAWAAPPNVLYWSDYDLGTNAVWAALGDLGWSVTQATGATDYNTKLGAGTWDLTCLLLQNSTYGTGWNTLTNVDDYVLGGGKALFTDWTRDATRGSTFGITYSGVNNQDPITLSGPFGAGTLDLSNPGTGWGIWSMGMTLNGASSAGTFASGDIGIAYTGNTVINGWLKDTAADAAVGKAVARAELEYLWNGGGAPTPELSTWALLACTGLLGLGVLRRRRSD